MAMSRGDIDEAHLYAKVTIGDAGVMASLKTKPQSLCKLTNKLLICQCFFSVCLFYVVPRSLILNVGLMVLIS